MLHPRPLTTIYNTATEYARTKAAFICRQYFRDTACCAPLHIVFIRAQQEYTTYEREYGPLNVPGIESVFEHVYIRAYQQEASELT